MIMNPNDKDLAQSKAEQADELLASADAKGMDEKDAEQCLADPSCSEDKRMAAEELLAECDAKGMSLAQAEAEICKEGADRTLGKP